MHPDNPPTSDREAHLDEVITAYLKATRAGEPANADDWLRRHPDLAPELAGFFADRRDLERIAAPLRGDVLPVGTTLRYFGDYELLEEVARGGMGVVYKARQVSLNRTVALKMILAGQLASPAEVQRFHAEAEAAAGLDHPNIVPIHEVGEHQGQHYFSMKLIEGRSLAQLLAAGDWPVGGREAEQRAATLLACVARAVHYA